MKGTISNFRLGRHTKSEKQVVVIVKSVKTREEAEKLKNKQVIWTSPASKKLIGKVLAPHGNSGAVKVGFETGMPGQAVGQKVEIV
jgi:large subunit ribosomal protein L35Ae